MEKVLNLFERLVIAVEKLAGNAPLPDAQDSPTEETAPKRGRGRPPKEATCAPTPAPAPAVPAPTPAPAPTPEVDDESWMNETPTAEVAPVAVSKADMRGMLIKFQDKVLKSGQKIREFIAKNTSNEATSIADIKESDYGKLYSLAESELKKAGH